MKKLLYLFLACSLSFWAESASAVELHNAQVNANVNLRQSPGLDGKIITVLEKGTRVTIKDRRGDWCQIAFENETFSVKAWVFAEYIKEIENLDEQASRPSTVEAKEPEQPEEPFQDKPPSEGPLANQALDEELPLAREMSQPLPETETAEKEGHLDRQEYSFEPDEEFHQRMLPVEGDSAVHDFAEKELAVASLTGSSPTYNQLKGFIGLLLIISSVALCFVGIAFFSKATQIARMNRETARQLARVKKKLVENEPEEKEKGELPRTRRMQEVDFVVEGRAYRGFIGNVSVGGAFIETKGPFRIDQQITLTFPSPTKNGCVKKSGKIVRTDSVGIGVRFTESVAHPGPP